MIALRSLAAAPVVSALARPSLAQQFQGLNLRLESFDTPEPYTDICGGAAEVALARLLELLNSNPFTVQTGGAD